MLTYNAPKQRNEWTLDIDRVPTTSKHRDEVARATIDWSDELETGETVSTSTWEGNGVTCASSGTTSTTTYTTISGTDGSAKNTVVTTGGTVARTLVRYLRFVGVPEGGELSDYQ